MVKRALNGVAKMSSVKGAGSENGRSGTGAIPLAACGRDLAAMRRLCGYFLIYIALRRKVWVVNNKRVYRLYRNDGLSLRLKKPRRNVSAADRERQHAALETNEMWSMDFVLDALFAGRRLRALTVIDAFTRSSGD